MIKLVLVLFIATAVTAVRFDDEDLDWWHHGVFYQIYPRSFMDSNGDGIGDIRGITERLGHLKDLGVTGAWLGPVFKSPMKDGGYDIEDFKTVDPIFGTNTDLMELIARGRELGIRFILDFVPNHTSSKHEWFQRSANRFPGFEDYYVWRDCPLNPDGVTRRVPNNWISVYHTLAWTYNADRDQCYLHQFTPEMPDLNLRNVRVQQEIIDIFRYWLEQGVDGFRVANANRLVETAGLPNEVFVNASHGDRTAFENLVHEHTLNRPESYEFIYDLRKVMDEFVDHSPAGNKTHKLMMVSAAMSTTQQLVGWYGSNETRLGSHVPLNTAFISKLDQYSNATEFFNVINEWKDAKPVWSGEEPNWLLGNHDSSRVASRFGEARHEPLAMITMMLPGTTTIYYGEEIMMVDNRNITFEQSDDPMVRQTNETVFQQFTRDPARTPFQWNNTVNAGFSLANATTGAWLPIHPNFPQRNLHAQMIADKSTYKLYQKLIELRRDKHVLKIGGFISNAIGEYVYGFMRVLRGHNTIAVIVNLHENATEGSLKDLMGDEFSGRTRAYFIAVTTSSDYEVGWRVDDPEKITLGPYEGIVLEVSSAAKLSISLLLIVCSLTKFIF